MAERIFFIVNPRSANGRTGQGWAERQRVLAQALGEFGVGMTEGALHAGQLAREALAQGYTRIVAVGGDGTLNEVLNGFASPTGLTAEGSALGYLPSATGGDLARTLGIAGQGLDGLIDRLRRDTPRALDCGCAVFRGPTGAEVTRLFMNEASIGFSADTVDAVNRSSKALGGKASFALGVLRCLAGLKNHVLSVTVDGQPFHEGGAFLLAISNGKYFGGGMMIAPQARPDDGLLDLVLLAPLSRLQVARHMGKIYKGDHLMLPEVFLGSGKRIEVRSPEDVLLEMDGEQPGKLDAVLSLLPGQIPFLL
ncbi:MAG: diacylglycerol kinase family lipid kinase [Myxococcota bacterium]|jgi:YegS/Rv2252/BmrU family lipid kinase|nr:diacylglycerol kinase family lipid kinase [Myxococcota bacterium]